MGEAGLRRRRRRRFLVVGLALLIGLAGLATWWVRPPRFFGPPVPDPNGYDTLLAAGRLVRGIPPAQGRAAEATDEELQGFLAPNDGAMARARAGLAQATVVPLARMASIEDHFEGVASLRQLGRLLTCRAVLARREGRTSDALHTNLDILRLAHAVAWGGLLMDQATGTAIRRGALQELEGPLLAKLSPADTRLALAEVARLGRDREPIQTIAQRDLDFVLSRQGLQLRVVYLLNRQAMDALRTPAIRAAESAEGQLQGQARTLLARLALQAYALDHPGRPEPADLRALVPAYLREVPLAPGATRPLTLDDLRPGPEAARRGPGRE